MTKGSKHSLSSPLTSQSYAHIQQQQVNEAQARQGGGGGGRGGFGGGGGYGAPRGDRW